MRLFIVGCMLMGATGCVPEMSCDELALLEPAIELGYGERRFIAFEDNDQIERHYGPQGGSHMYFAVKAVGLHPGSKHAAAPELRFEVIDDDGRIIAGGDTSHSAFSGSGYGSELSGITAVDTWLAYEEYDAYLADQGASDGGGFPVNVHVQAIDSCGTIVEDERRVLFSLF